MQLTFFKNTLLLFLVLGISCGSEIEKKNSTSETQQTISEISYKDSAQIVVGANQTEKYLPLLKGKKVGIVANQTSILKVNTIYRENGIEVFDLIEKHLVDFLHSKEIDIKYVFAPEHGFRGIADAGELVNDGIDTKTGLPILSLYGKNKKPTRQQLEGIDIMVFDIQDVGARFYTYISSLHYIMEACAEAGIPLLILDRPNPNGHYIDGPILEIEHSSFVGMHPVPVVHGMTIGEYAQMINGQGWLTNNISCKLTIISVKNYTHHTPYSLPIKPSPNLPNDTAINLYPSLCFFEGTYISAGRGTDTQFQVFGAPNLPSENYHFSFTPQENEGAKYPKFKNELCYGEDLRNEEYLEKLNLEWLIEAYVTTGKKDDFFNSFFTKLAGTKKLQQQIEQGYTYKEIRKTWYKDLESYDRMRQQYLLYE